MLANRFVTESGSYVSGKCHRNLYFFKVREFYDLSGKN